MILELINPSDKMTFAGDDVKIAGVAVLLLGRGWYALEDGDGNTVVPFMGLGGSEEWLAEQGIENLGAFVLKNCEALAAFLETCAYGGIAEREAFDQAIARMTPDKAAEHRAWWNDRQRSSLNDIGAGAAELAKALRERAEKLPSSPPLVFGG